MPERRPISHACEDDAREALLKAREALTDAGGLAGAGCLSMRWHRSGGAGMLITGVAATLQAAAPEAPAILWLPLEERRGFRPAVEAPQSDEWRLHRDLYQRRADVEAIVRCRPTYATALACSSLASRDGIPAFHPDLAAVAGGALACVDCGLPGASLKVEALVPAIRDGWACLLAGWGLLSWGTTLGAATSRAVEVEALARIWWHVLQLEGAREPR
jgi:L-fuculose-phosphate aldolase